MTDAPAPTPRTLSLSQQAAINLLGFLVVSITTDDRTQLVADLLAEALPEASKNVPPGMELLFRAAEGMVAAFPARLTRDGSLAWNRANMRAGRELANLFHHRAILAIDAQQTRPTDADA